jgi:hypothetical protein
LIVIRLQIKLTELLAIFCGLDDRVDGKLPVKGVFVQFSYVPKDEGVGADAAALREIA